MTSQPRVIVVGGLAFNIPKELTESVEIVKHVEQSSSYRVGTLPNADFILVISEFASHNLIDVVRNQVNVPVIRLPKGWAGMKTELQKRCILPPDSSPVTRAPEAAATEVPTTTGLSEDELWRLYRNKLIEAAKGALKPRELISEADLLEALGDLVGIPKEDVRLLLPRLHMGGIVVPVQDGVWSLMIGEDSYEFDTSPPPPPKTRRVREPQAGGQSLKEQAFDRARKISGLLMGPYPTIAALCREMQKYKEFQHEDGTPLSMEGCRKLVQKGVELKIVDDSHTKLYVDHKPEIVLTRAVTPSPQEQEPVPVPAPVLSEAGKSEAIADEYKDRMAKKSLAEMTKEEAEANWSLVVNEIKQQKRHLGTILENGRIQWLPESAILIFLVPQEFSVYLHQLESTENWGLIASYARTRFGSGVVIRFVLDNGAKKVRA